MVIFLLILALIVAVAAFIFALQNTAIIPVTFFVWQFNQSLALVLLLALAAGVLIGLFTILPGAIRTKWRTSVQRKRIESLEKTLQETQFKLEQAKLEIVALQQKPETSAPINAPTPPPDTNPPIEQSPLNE
jgi:putative membrane protein